MAGTVWLVDGLAGCHLTAGAQADLPYGDRLDPPDHDRPRPGGSGDHMNRRIIRSLRSS